MATIIDFKTRKAIVPTEIVREELDGAFFLDDLGEPETEQKEMDEYQREQAAHRLLIPPYPNLCMHCGDPIESDDAVHPECIKAYEDYWDEREREYTYRESTAQMSNALDICLLLSKLARRFRQD